MMTAARRTRIMIVDDSVVMRSLLRSVVTADAGLEVAGTAADGATALNSLEALRPDLLLLDVEMPVMDGLVTLRNLRTRGHRMPVIMCSALTRRGARVTIEALAGGASDYVAKPTGQSSREEAIQALSQDLIPRIHALTGQQRLPGAVPAAAAGESGFALGIAVAGFAAKGPAGFSSAGGAGDWRLYRRPGSARRPASGASRCFFASRPDRAAHAGGVYPAVCRAPG